MVRTLRGEEEEGEDKSPVKEEEENVQLESARSE